MENTTNSIKTKEDYKAQQATLLLLESKLNDALAEARKEINDFLINETWYERTTEFEFGEVYHFTHPIKTTKVEYIKSLTHGENPLNEIYTGNKSFDLQGLPLTVAEEYLGYEMSDSFYEDFIKSEVSQGADEEEAAEAYWDIYQGQVQDKCNDVASEYTAEKVLQLLTQLLRFV